jgi:hypothetical protein
MITNETILQLYLQIYYVLCQKNLWYIIK